ncbi:sensor histidine kinase [Pusillimonas noertemannii]|uniref:sensor histidine kinase n=1 Tax=Pusillimonas noertemannii TaxID=305977 RepID=UPI0003731274|nr:ATP-binding protein [Pusillimonas noertemannii]
MIEDILAGGHDDFRLLNVDPGPVQLEVFLTELCVHGRTWCIAGNNDFSLRVLTELPGQIQTDERRLKQVLLNLISNAALATRRGTIALHVAASPGEFGSAKLEFKVLDTGPGIEAGFLAMLFQKNQRPDQEWPGTGLGLYIAQRIAKNMGGVLEVVSESGKGSCFSLVLRVPACSQTPLPAEWQPLESKLETGGTAVAHGPPSGGKPPGVVLEKLAAYALQGSYSDIDKLLESAVFSSSCHDGFRIAVKAALDELDFDAIHQLAQRG